ncbi:hypothetical protein VTK26DRAFT_8758 [Humicola hyalothermophila]
MSPNSSGCPGNISSRLHALLVECRTWVAGPACSEPRMWHRCGTKRSFPGPPLLAVRPPRRKRAKHINGSVHYGYSHQTPLCGPLLQVRHGAGQAALFPSRARAKLTTRLASVDDQGPLNPGVNLDDLSKCFNDDSQLDHSRLAFVSEIPELFLGKRPCRTGKLEQLSPRDSSRDVLRPGVLSRLPPSHQEESHFSYQCWKFCIKGNRL